MVLKIIRTVAIYQSLFNATMGTFFIEIIIAPFIFPMKKLLGEEAAERFLSKFRHFYTIIMSKLMFAGGQIDIKLINEQDFEKELPVCYFFTHSSNFDPFIIGNDFFINPNSVSITP